MKMGRNAKKKRRIASDRNRVFQVLMAGNYKVSH